MLIRVRWFVLGALSGAGGAIYVVDQLRRAREALTPRNLARGGARGVASLIDAAAERIAPDPTVDLDD
jgi:hypothetical protein